MSLSLHVTGLSYRTAHVELREKLAFRADELTAANTRLLAYGFRESAILSTCNRVEIITAAPLNQPVTGACQRPAPDARIRAFLSEFRALPETEFGKALYSFSNEEAAQHLFEVASSLDSQILGETEILSQAREAYRVSGESGCCGPLLRSLFERAFFLSKEVRHDGGIGRSQASVSSAAVALAKKLFEIKGCNVLVVGSGEMATGIVRALKHAGTGEIWVTSRTASRAEEFAKREGGTPCDMARLPEHMAKCDIVLVSTAAPHFIILPPQVQAAMRKRGGQPLCFIDISVPRNVDPDVNNIDDVFLYDIDDLEEIASDGRREREAVASRWRPRLAEEARVFLREFQERGPAESARKLMEAAEALRKEILKQTKTGMSPEAAAELDRALSRFQGKLLHGPLETLRQAAREGDGGDAAAWVSRLFRLDSESTPESTNAADAAAPAVAPGATPSAKPPAPVQSKPEPVTNAVCPA